MSEKPARLARLDIPDGRRILVVSDIHGNLPYFKALLKQAEFSDADELIIDGDFLEKGAESLNTLRLLMEMSARGNTHVVCGNCDDWTGVFSPDRTEEQNEHTLQYVLWRKSGLLWDMMNGCGIDPFEIEGLADIRTQLLQNYAREWDFLSKTPHAIEMENFVFAHAGMRPDKPLRQHTAAELDRCDSFLTRGWSFNKWVIVGHWPVMLYGADKVCANPIIDRDKKIASIDGGCVLKDDGQLNALIIPDKRSGDFSFTAYDPFPTAIAMDDQEEGERSYYIRWGDSTVRVLRRGEEFSLCRHVRTGYEMEILTKYLFTDNEVTDCNDATDYILPVKAGDELRVVERTSKGCLVKRGGYSGWYRGRLE